MKLCQLVTQWSSREPSVAGVCVPSIDTSVGQFSSSFLSGSVCTLDTGTRSGEPNIRDKALQLECGEGACARPLKP